MAPLDGRVIAVLEARRANDMASLISRHGGVFYSAPAMKEAPLDNQGDVAAFIEQLVKEPVSVVIFLTGVGARALLEAASSLGRLEAVLTALKGMTVVARGPKPVALLKQYQVRIDLVPPEPNTSHELLEMLRPLGLAGKTVAMQHYGRPNMFLRNALWAEGASVLEVFLYRWELPDDRAPLIKFISDVKGGTIDVVAGTSQMQIHNLFKLAQHFDQEGALRKALNDAVAVAAVGPVCAQAWHDWGIKVDIVPEHPKMGHLVLAIAEYCQTPGSRQAAGVAAESTE